MLCAKHTRALNALRRTFKLYAARSFSTIQATADSEKDVKPLSQFQERKVLQQFDHVYDRNKDGYICKDDINSLKSELNRYYQKHNSDIMYTTHMTGYDDYWTLFTELADKNRDGQLSKKEWLDMWAHINDQAQDVSFLSLPMWVRLMPASLFPAMDSKRDGVIDFEEYQHFWFYLANYDCKYTKMRTMFEAMTQDGQKKLDMKRFEELFADYYLSKDPRTPGKYIAGPVELLSEPKWFYI